MKATVPAVTGIILIMTGVWMLADAAKRNSMINSFAECAAAGNPVMESYPRRCNANGKSFTEDVADKQPAGASMTDEEARKIAESTCIKGGEAPNKGIYHEWEKMWWYEANLNTTREGCRPWCVVKEEDKTAEIKWICAVDVQ